MQRNSFAAIRLLQFLPSTHLAGKMHTGNGERPD